MHVSETKARHTRFNLIAFNQVARQLPLQSVQQLCSNYAVTCQPVTFKTHHAGNCRVMQDGRCFLWNFGRSSFAQKKKKTNK